MEVLADLIYHSYDLAEGARFDARDLCGERHFGEGLILGGGGVISDGTSLGQSLLLLLDAIQPVGIMPVLLDQNNLLPLLGVAASRSHYLPVQVIESGAFIGLGTVVSVIASANYGDQVLRARLAYADGTEARAEVLPDSRQQACKRRQEG